MSTAQVGIVIGVSGYLAVMLLVGVLVSRRIRTTADYIVAGGRLGWALSVGTIFATWFGAETCMGAANTARTDGLLGVIADPFGAGLCLVIAGVFLVGVLHRMRIETIVDFFELRYGRSFALFSSWFYLPVYLGWVGAQMLAFGTVLHALTSLSLTVAVTVSASVVIVYTYCGGMWADAITDIIQMVFIVGCFLVLFAVVVARCGGPAACFAGVPPELLRFTPASASALDWLGYAESWIIVGLGSLGAQDLISRIMAARSVRVARWSSVGAGVLYWTMGALPVFLGILSLKVLPPDYGGRSVLIDLSLRYLPLPLVALFVGGLLSAIMSSVDSAMLAPASIIGHNIVPYLFRSRGVDDAAQLRICKLSVPVIGILSLAAALWFGNIYALCLESWTVLLTSITAPLLLGAFWKRAGAAGAFTGAVAGTATWLLLAAAAPAGYPVKLAGFVVSTAGVVVGSLVVPGDRAPAVSAGTGECGRVCARV